MSDLIERCDAPSRVDWLRYFLGKVGSGACICEGQEISAAADEIERLTAENKMLRHTHRWNVEPQADDSLLVCRNLHEKDEKCDLEHYVPAERLHDAIRERDDLRRQLAEAERDARRYRWLRGEHKRVDPICAVIWKRNGDRNGSEWVNTANIDAEIDAAMGASNE